MGEFVKRFRERHSRPPAYSGPDRLYFDGEAVAVEEDPPPQPAADPKGKQDHAITGTDGG